MCLLSSVIRNSNQRSQIDVWVGRDGGQENKCFYSDRLAKITRISRAGVGWLVRKSLPSCTVDDSVNWHKLLVQVIIFVF